MRRDAQSMTSTHRSHLLSSGDVLQNLFQLLLDASSPVNHSGKCKKKTLSICIAPHHHLSMSWPFTSPVIRWWWVCQKESLPIFVYLSQSVVKLPYHPPPPPSFPGSLSGRIPVPPPVSGLNQQQPPSCTYLVGSGRLGRDQRLRNKTAQVWQKCTLSRSWSPLDGAKFGIKRSNSSSSPLYISQQATNDLMDQDFHKIISKQQQRLTC